MKERTVSGADANYRIAEGDELFLQVLGVGELNGTFRVSELGKIALPLVAPTRVEGLTVKEATASIRRALEGHLQDPVVKISMAKRKGAQVAVMGAVGEPGSYSLEGFDETLADIITRAEGITNQAGPTLFLFPAGSGSGRGKTLVASSRPSALISGSPVPPDGGVEIDLTRLYRGQSVPELSLPLRAGDAIVIPFAGEVFVNGWVEYPGGYPLQMRMTVTGAVARAGGLHFGASRGPMKLVRIGAGGKATVHEVSYSEALSNTAKDPYLKAGDRLEVPPNPARVAGWGVYYAIKSLFTFQAGGRVVHADLSPNDTNNDRRLIDERENALPPP